LLKPLAAIALLWVLLLLPTRLAQLAMLGANAVRGGFVSRAASYAAGSHLREVTRQHLPGWAGGQAGAGTQRTRGTDSRLGARLRAESTVAATKAAGAGGAFAAASAATAGSSSARRSPRPGQATGEGPGEASNGSAEHLPGWLGRIRRPANARAYSPPP